MTKSNRRRIRRNRRIGIVVLMLLIIAIIAVIIILIAGKACAPSDPQNSAEPTGTLLPGDTDAPISLDPTPSPTPIPTPTPEPTPTPIPDPTSVAETNPDVFGLQVEMELDGEPISSYVSDVVTYFGDSRYAAMVKGITTFRGNNFRDDATYGSAGAISEKKLELIWTTDIPGSISKSGGSGTWFGVGWTGQPLIVEWDSDMRQIMNMYDEYKAKDGLIEVIYATENSYIYFLDMEDGSFTRNYINGKWTFKGSGALDPRGYPLLYVGAGDAGPNGAARNFIFSLIDGSVLYEYGASDPYSLRNFKGFDGSTIVDAENDYVTYASECGIIYRFKLNTEFDPDNGTISVSPSDILKWRYTTARSREGGTAKYWLGFEASPIMWRNYMYVSDNGGNMFCIDVNTMEVIWMQDIIDDTNCTPIFEINEEAAEAYIYTGTSAHWTVDGNNEAKIPFFKLDAITGEVLWEAPGFTCTRTNVSGGVQASPASGKHNVSNLVFVSYALTVGTDTGGTLVAYDKETGSIVWQRSLSAYSYSSPVVVYDDDGNGYIVTFDASAKMYLIDAANGTVLDSIQLEGNFEGSPAVYGDMVVIGSRGSKIFGIRIK
ncbi:MAG: PQQ-binding-like beta-propeller repeat protein [Clostridia bacterium]|nr:PQQ-binding-like beta-propeller repeat protein [Clostridia bacterium]